MERKGVEEKLAGLREAADDGRVARFVVEFRIMAVLNAIVNVDAAGFGTRSAGRAHGAIEP